MQSKIGAVDACVDEFNSYVKSKIPALEVLTEWPAANQKLNYPSVTITVGKDKRTPIQPETICVSQPDEDGKAIERLAIAHYDIPMQLDLWCRTLKERRQYLNAIMDLFNGDILKDTGPYGLSLKLTNYFDLFARYEVDTHEFRDDEIAVERQERRAMISLLVNTREIVERSMYIIKSMVVKSEFTSSNEELTDDTTDTESDLLKP